MNPVCHLTPDCSLTGKITTLPENKKPVYSFLGIPYAQPPVGPLRFQAPQPVQLWKGQRQATEFGPVCPQNKKAAQEVYKPFPFPINMDENCLFLNVWTPDMDGKLPVMVWIHGGSFILGFGDIYNGTALATLHDVVVVSINYRLGPFGFLCSEDGAIPANNALLDQLEALRFVKKYIGKFGGDPDNVTAFGESAGAICIGMHLVSPLARGLFRRAICQSGTAYYPGAAWTPHQMAKYASKRLCKDGRILSGAEMLQILSTKSATEIVDMMGPGFSPVLDGSYLPRDPRSLYSAKEIHPCDVMTGINSHEGTQFVLALTQRQLVENKAQAQALVERWVKVNFYRGNPNAERIVAAIMEYYLAGVADDDQEGMTAALVDIYGDINFNASTLSVAGNLAERGRRTYLYHYVHRPSFSSLPAWVGADHGQEIGAVFGEPYLGRIGSRKWEDDDREVSRHVMEMWTHFAKTGDPGMSWPEYNPRSPQCLTIQSQPHVTMAPRQEAARFWNQHIHAIASGQAMAKY